MKRTFKLFLVFGVLFFILCISGCFGKTYPPLVEGEFVLEKFNDSNKETSSFDSSESEYPFAKVKLEIYRIDEQAYNAAGGKNVMYDFTQKNGEPYYSFNVFLFFEDSNEYKHIDLLYEDLNQGFPVCYFYPSDKDDIFDCYVIFDWAGLYSVSFETTNASYAYAYFFLLSSNSI